MLKSGQKWLEIFFYCAKLWLRKIKKGKKELVPV